MRISDWSSDVCSSDLREAKLLQLRAHGCDILARPASRMHILFHGCVLSGHAEGVPAHGVQHFMPDHPAEACQYASHRLIADMADMNAAGGFRKLHQHIAAWLFTIVQRANGMSLTPVLLPAATGHKTPGRRPVRDSMSQLA